MLIDLLELASNNALEYDRCSRDRLAKLQGKTITLEIKPFSRLQQRNQRISVTPQPHGLEFSGLTLTQPDVTLTTTLGALIKIGRAGLDEAQLEPGELEISGDAIVGQRFARVLAELNVDWEGLLAEHIGEPPAVLISTGFEKAKALAEESKSALRQHLNTLLIDDLEIIARQTEVEPFLDEVDNLRADADRLQARVKRLQKRL
ncbi:MAG: hypothetical protein HKN85_07040 [Gammaproteobacteria bacterium]|nr:hypothetical protein [Gammaproteobacteria bacterium]